MAETSQDRRSRPPSMVTKLRPLKPGFVLKSWPDGDPIGNARITSMSRHLEAAALRRDCFRCTTCGFASLHGLVALALTEPPRGVEDYETQCRFCAQVEHMEMAVSAKSARLCWLPELSQVEINRGFPGFLIAEMSLRGKKDPDIQALRRLLTERYTRAHDILGFDSTAPLKGILKAASASDAARTAFMDRFDKGLRLLPLDRWIERDADLEFNTMPKVLANWRIEARDARGPIAEIFQQSASAWLERLGGAS